MNYHQFVEILAEELLTEPGLIQPESLLVDELGVQSIDIVQIVERAEDALGRSLEGIDFQEIETVEELFWVVIGQAFDAEDSLVAALARQAAAEVQAPHEIALQKYLRRDSLADVSTLIGMLNRRAALSPDRIAISFDGADLSYRQLARDIAQTARALRVHGVKEGDRVVIVMPNCLEFFSVYYGIQHLRGAAVPVFHGSRSTRIANIAGECGASAIVTLKPLPGPFQESLQEKLVGKKIRILDAPTLRATSTGMAGPLPIPRPDDLAMLQFTSGTTGHSKGVMLTHQALIANVRQMIPPARFHRDDVFVSWLPVYHDMGLITMTMCPFYLGARLVLLPVSLKPHAWLRAITEEKGTMTAAPDFAYRYALRFSGDAACYDLRSLRFALVAAEPVRARTIARFEQAFGISGVLKPGYGLAEASVAVSFWPLDRPELTVDDDGAVSVGLPLVGVEIDIRDDEGNRVPRGTHGEICFRSPSQTSGYYRNASGTAELFTSDEYVRTGDIGYLDQEGRLFVVGRSKDIIIIAGRNLSPKELEEIAETVPEVVAAMALGIDTGGDAGEQVLLFVESRQQGEDATTLARTVRRHVQSAIGIRPDRVEVLAPRSIPRTYNGKLQYGEMRKRILAAREANAK